MSTVGGYNTGPEQGYRTRSARRGLEILGPLGLGPAGLGRELYRRAERGLLGVA